MIQRRFKRSRELITLTDWRKAKYAILYYMGGLLCSVTYYT